MHTGTNIIGKSFDRLKRHARALLRDTAGVTAIEFAFVGPVFFAIIGATLETGLTFFAGQTLDAAVHDTARLIRTGQAGSMSEPDYRQALCDHLYGMFDCDEVRLSIHPIDSFSDSEAQQPVDPDSGSWTFDSEYDTGAGSTIVMVEAFYKWPSIVSIPGITENLLPDGTRLLGATRVFRNEPF